MTTVELFPMDAGTFRLSTERAAKVDPGSDDKMVIVYDGECPFCRNYVRLMELRKVVGNVDLVNARTPHPAVSKLVELGYDPTWTAGPVFAVQNGRNAED
jgi:hypothetical protein